MDTFTGQHAREWIDRFAAVVERQGAELTELDRRAGDGDYGTNLRSALRRTKANLDELDGQQAGTENSGEAVFTAIANAFLHTGGTSGPLFGVWFREFAKATTGELTSETIAAAASNAAAAVQRLGKAEVGHKTMVDAMVPAARALRVAAERGAEVRTALRDAATAAHGGAAATEEQLARRGRASYVGEHARGVVDPGALTVAMFFEAATPSTVRREAVRPGL